jgi:hypothetical protein
VASCQNEKQIVLWQLIAGNWQLIAGNYAKISRATRPLTSVSRKSRPL